MDLSTASPEDLATEAAAVAKHRDRVQARADEAMSTIRAAYVAEHGTLPATDADAREWVRDLIYTRPLDARYRAARRALPFFDSHARSLAIADGFLAEYAAETAHRAA